MKTFGIAAALALTIAAAAPAVAADKTASADKAASVRTTAPVRPAPSTPRAVTQTAKHPQVVRAKAIRTARRQLTRKWVWTRNTQRFDGMFRK